MTNRTVSIFMYFNLLKQADAWSTALTGMYNQRMKQKFNHTVNVTRNLLDEMEKELEREDPEHMERFWEDSEIFSNCLEMIRTAPMEKKHDLFLIMKEYSQGTLTIKEL